MAKALYGRAVAEDGSPPPIEHSLDLFSPPIHTFDALFTEKKRPLTDNKSSSELIYQDSKEHLDPYFDLQRRETGHTDENHQSKICKLTFCSVGTSAGAEVQKAAWCSEN